MAVESLVFASSCSEYELSSLNVASLPAVVVHTGVAIDLTPYTGIYWRSAPVVLGALPVFYVLSYALTIHGISGTLELFLQPGYL